MSTLEALASQSEAGTGFAGSMAAPLKFITGPGGTSVLPLQVPVRVRDQRFDVHDGITLLLGTHEAEIRLPAGVDVQTGDTVTMMMEIKHSGCEQFVMRQAQVLKTKFDDAETVQPGEDDGLYMHIVIHWDKALNHWPQS